MGLEYLDLGHKQRPLTSEGDELVAPAARRTIWPPLVQGRTEALCGGEGARPDQGVIALLNAARVLREAAVPRGVVTRLQAGAQDFPPRPRVGVLCSGRRGRGSLSGYGPSLPEEALWRRPVAGGTQQRVHPMAFLIDSPVPVTPATVPLQVRFSDLALRAEFSRALPTKRLG
jgi:hypothetical protein